MKKIGCAVVCVLLAAAFIAAANPPKKTASVEGITEYQFDNGLRLLLFPDNSQSKITVNMTVLVGSRQEGFGETGMAHLLEHMAFKGTPRHPHIPKDLQDHGAQFNGSTTSDRVNYFETMPAGDDNLKFALDLEADRLVNSYIKREDLDSEMTVVRNEFERGENSPDEVLSERIAAAAYNWHNYGKPTIGNRSDIEHVPIENLRAFYRKYYQPDNIILIVAGKLDEAKTLGWVDETFGAIPRPDRVLSTSYTVEPPQEGERSVVLRRVGDVGVVSLAYHIPAAAHPDIAALQVLGDILSSQPSGRLYKLLIEPGKAASVSAFAGSEHDPSLFTVDAEVPREGSLDTVRDLLLNAVEHVASTPVTDEEVNRARQQILKARERAAANTSQVAVSLSGWAAEGDWRLYFLSRDRVQKVTPADVQRVASTYLQQDNRTLGVFIPTAKAERVAIPEAPDLAAIVADYKGRAVMAQGEAFEATPENVEARAQRSDLPEGIKVTLMPRKTRGEEANLILTLRFGNEENLKGYDVAAGFLPELMMRGTKEMSYQKLRDELDRLGATLSPGAGGGRRGGGRRGGPQGSNPGMIAFSIQAKRDTMPEVIGLMRQVLREPLLPADQFEILKNERIARIEQMKTEPAVLGPRLLERELNPWPKDDVRYVPTVDESLARLRAVSYDQVAELYHDYLGSQQGELTIVGDFDSKACLDAVKPALEGWRAAKPYARIPTPVAGQQTGAKHVIDTPDKANATYTAGLVFPLRDDDPDYPAMVMANYIFGGGGTLSSRLGDRIRQKEGLTYGVSSALSVSAQDQRAVLTITAICNPTNMARVESCVHEELDRLLKDGVTPEELEKAKRAYLEGQRVARENDGALAALLTGSRHLDRTLQFDADVEKKIAALTIDQVMGAFRHYVDPTRLVVVTAGDLAAPAASKL